MTNRARLVILTIVALLSAAALALGSSASGLLSNDTSGDISAAKPRLVYFYALW